MLSLKSLLQGLAPGILRDQTRPGILTAGSTGEAAVMVEVAHGLASLVCSIHALAALHTGTWGREERSQVGLNRVPGDTGWVTAHLAHHGG